MLKQRTSGCLESRCRNRTASFHRPLPLEKLAARSRRLTTHVNAGASGSNFEQPRKAVERASSLIRSIPTFLQQQQHGSRQSAADVRTNASAGGASSSSSQETPAPSTSGGDSGGSPPGGSGGDSGGGGGDGEGDDESKEEVLSLQQVCDAHGGAHVEP